MIESIDEKEPFPIDLDSESLQDCRFTDSFSQNFEFSFSRYGERALAANDGLSVYSTVELSSSDDIAFSTDLPLFYDLPVVCDKDNDIFDNVLEDFEIFWNTAVK